MHQTVMPFGKYAGRELSQVPIDYFKWLQFSGGKKIAEDHPILWKEIQWICENDSMKSAMERLPHAEKWFKLRDEEPVHNCRLLIWRKKNRKYTVAHLQTFEFKLEEERSPFKNLDWVTEHHTVHQAHPEDRWYKFPPVKVIEETTYD